MVLKWQIWICGLCNLLTVPISMQIKYEILGIITFNRWLKCKFRTENKSIVM